MLLPFRWTVFTCTLMGSTLFVIAPSLTTPPASCMVVPSKTGPFFCADKSTRKKDWLVRWLYWSLTSL